MKRIAGILLVVLLCVACGYKGDLYLPSPAEKDETLKQKKSQQG